MLIALKLKAGRAHGGQSAQIMFDTVGEGDILLADRAHDPAALRVADSGTGRLGHHRPRAQSQAPPVSSTYLNPYRSLIDRFFNRFGPSRAVATRQVKRDDKFLASVPLTSLSIWLRLSESIT